MALARSTTPTPAPLARAGGFQLRPFLALVGAVALIVGVVWLVDPDRGASSGESGDATSVNLTGRSGVTPRPGEMAPAFTLDRLGGGTTGLAQLKGHPVLVNFWASWCPPCRGEMPDLETIAREYHDSGLVVLALNLQEDPATVQRYADALGLSVTTVALDRGGTVANRYNLTALPSSYFVDREGIVRDLNVGALTAKGLRTKLAKVLD